MPRRTTKNTRLMEELSEQLDEVTATLKSYDFDIEECEVDERDCHKEHGDSLFRVYELVKELREISREE